MDISVVIPTYNRASLVERAIRSVLAQHFSAYEIVVVDDGSSDDTVHRISRNFPDIQLITQPNRGVSAARNAGINAAIGEWIAFLDSDDVWNHKKLMKQVAGLKSCPEYEICHTDETWIRDGRRVNPMKKHAKPHGWIFEHCLPLCCVSPSSVLVKKALLDTVGLFDETLPACEDYDLWLRIFSRVPVLLVPDQLLEKHGGHADQLSRKYFAMDRFRVMALVNILEKGQLNPSQRISVIEILLYKLNILINGFSRRNNEIELERYQRIYDNWNRPGC